MLLYIWREMKGMNLVMIEILICGQAELFTENALLKLAEEYRVVVVGKLNIKNLHKNIVTYNISLMEEKFYQLFDVYNFRTVFYISGYADGGNGVFGESQQLERVMETCRDFRIDKVVIFSAIDSCNYLIQHEQNNEMLKKDYYSNRTFGAGQMEEACAYYTERFDVKTIILRLPYLVDEINDKNFLGDVFHKLYEGEKVLFPYHEEDPVDFLSFSDVIELMIQLIEETEDESSKYYVVSGYHYKYSDLEEMLKLSVPDAQIMYERYPYTIEYPEYPVELRKRYGFVPMDNAMENIGFYYRTFVKKVAGRRLGIFGGISRLFSSMGKGILKYVELIILFIVAEIISHYTSESIYFRFVDVRLFYILIIGTVHGMKTGLLAALMECLVLIREYTQMGMNGTIVFYNIENWIPFVIYLMTGSITGYIATKKDETITFIKKEYSLLRDKYLFLNNVYHGAIENKGEYKKQILGFKDSFGKIFDAVQKLDSELPERIFLGGVGVLEDILENHTIAIYMLDSWQKYGRLAVCSNSLLSTLTKSIKIEEYKQVYDTVIKRRVWKNSEMIEGLPMYACGIFRDESLVLLVTIQEAGLEQYGMHYMNIFQILCGLVQTSFLRALAYEKLAEEKTYYPNTNVVYPERFRRALEVQEAMKQEGIADYVLIRFIDHDKQRISEQLAGLIRGSDMLGADEEGNIFLLLMQVNRKTFGIVGERLRNKGVQYQIIEKNA